MAKVLVVDDNADERLIYSAVLHYHGHDVIEAARAQQGLDAARQAHPAVILMDVHMPDMNGLLAAEILRAGEETSSIPIVCVTGYDVSLAQARAAGCVAFLRKPVSPSELIKTVSSVLSGSDAEAH